MAIDGPLQIAREDGKAPGTLILRLSGPLTLRNIFDLQAQLRNAKATPVTILDLTEVPYMDSAGMGVVVNFHVHCQNLGGRLIAVGVSPADHGAFQDHEGRFGHPHDVYAGRGRGARLTVCSLR